MSSLGYGAPTRGAAMPRLPRGKHKLALLSLAVLAATANAGVLYDQDGTEVRWDNTLKYSTGWRLKSPSTDVLNAGAGPNGDDGDLNFRKGHQISNRVDWLSELDVRTERVGARLSWAAWYDDVYNRGPALQPNPSFPFSTNNAGGRFFPDTEKLQGRYAEVLDAFVFANFNLGSAPTTVRVGQHTLLWGESIFLAGNGIASAMAPLNIAKGVAVPNTQAKELFMPVKQVSVSSKVSDNATVEAYVQFEWKGSRLPGAGSYFSDVDIYGPGGNNLFTPPNVPLWAPFTVLPRDDRNPSDSGQYGLALKYRAESLDTDFGLYALRFHDKASPVNFYLTPTGAPVGCAIPAGPLGPGCGVPLFTGGNYGFLYGEKVELYGLSASTTFGDWNVAGELSWRRNAALRTAVPALTAPDASLLARGDTYHYQVSAIRAFGGTPLWDASSVVFEVGGHHLGRFRSNEASFDTAAASRDAFGARGVFTATYYRVMPGLDIDVPIGIGYSPKARSPIDNKFNMGGADKGGDLSVGVNFTYRNKWKAGAGYTTYFGKVSDGQAFKDRDFISIYLQTTL